MMKTKILHIVLSLGTGGLENGIVNIINGSDPEAFQIDVVCLRERGPLAKRIKNTQSKVFFDETSGEAGDESLGTAVRAIRKACREHDYHIVHAHGWATMLAGYIAGKLERTPIIINGEHGTLYFDTWKQRIIQRFLFNRMRLNLSVSSALISEISQRFGVSTKKFKAILNGVDVERFKPSATSRLQVRESLDIDPDQPLVGSVGRLVEVKNYPSLINAFAVVLKTVPRAKLLLAGDGPEQQKLVAQVKALKIQSQVLFLGRRDDIPDVMNSLDVFVLPSFREGLSNTILEAMASGLAAVVTAVGGSPEVVIHGKTGYLFEVSNIDSLASHLCELLVDSEKLERMSQKARSHVVENYSLETMVDNYQKTYRRLMLQQGLLDRGLDN